MSAKFKARQIVVTGTGADCYMGQVVKVKGAWVTIKYADFVTPRTVHAAQVRPVGR
jgi:hypothetical protein